jgi:predicted phage terminase large subunit-like protein
MLPQGVARAARTLPSIKKSARTERAAPRSHVDRGDAHAPAHRMIHIWNAKCVVLETSGVGAAIGNALLKREGARQWLCSSNPKLGKVDRATAQTPKIERKRVYLPMSASWLETFESEVATFPNSKYADQVDSMVHFLRLLDHRNRWTSDLSALREHRDQPF